MSRPVSNPSDLAKELDLRGVRGRLTWLLLFRGIVVTILLVGAIAVRLSTEQNAVLGTPPLILYAVCLVNYVSVLGAALWLQSHGTHRVIGVSRISVVADALTATALVLTGGGTNSPWTFLFSVGVLAAAAVLEREGAIFCAAWNTLLYFCVLLLEAGGFLTQQGPPSPVTRLIPTFTVNLIAIYAVAVLAVYLTEQLRRTSESLTAARQSLVEIERLHEAMLESLDAGVVTVDDSGQVMFVNHAAQRLLSMSNTEIVGQTTDTLSVLKPMIHTPIGQSFEEQVDAADGPMTLGGRVSKLKGLEGLHGRVLVFEDLTELRALQNEMARNRELASLGRFAAALAHEIRNPLAAMMGCLHLLQSDVEKAHQVGGRRIDDGDEEKEGDAKRLVGIVSRETERLAKLVSVFLEYARPADPNPVVVDVYTLLVETLETIRASEAAESVVIDLDVLEAPAPKKLDAVCDPEQLRQVLWNLLGNAVDAVTGKMVAPEELHPQQTLSKEHRNARIRIQATTSATEIELRIDDNGPGVPASLRARITEPFFTTRATGTGLGLASTDALLQAQGGSLEVDQAPPPLNGARFVVRLPRAMPSTKGDDAAPPPLV